MIRHLSLAALIAVIATPAMAAEATCSKAPASKFQSTKTLRAKLSHQGMTVRRIKTEGGCYEVYAVNKAGKKVNLAFNAETLKKVRNPEAGED